MITFTAILLIVIVVGAIVGTLIAFLPSAALSSIEKNKREARTEAPLSDGKE